MHCNNLRLVLGLGLVRVSSRVTVKVRVSVMVRVSIRTSWVVNFALFCCYWLASNLHSFQNNILRSRALQNCVLLASYVSQP